MTEFCQYLSIRIAADNEHQKNSDEPENDLEGESGHSPNDIEHCSHDTQC